TWPSRCPSGPPAQRDASRSVSSSWRHPRWGRRTRGRGPPRGLIGTGLLGVGHGAAREDVGETLDVGAGDHVLARLVLLAQAVDELGAQGVDLPVEDPALVGDVDLLFGQLLDEVLELLIRERAEVRKRVHWVFLLSNAPRGSGATNIPAINFRLRLISCAIRRVRRVRTSRSRSASERGRSPAGSCPAS